MPLYKTTRHYKINKVTLNLLQFILGKVRAVTYSLHADSIYIYIYIYIYVCVCNTHFKNSTYYKKYTQLITN